MSFWATITLSWVGVYAFLCVFYCVLYARRREGLEYLMFGLYTGFMAVYTGGASMLTDAASYEIGRRAQDMQFWSGLLASPFYLHFMYAFVYGRAPKWIWAAYAIGASTIPVGILGLAFAPGEILPPKVWGFDSAPSYPEAERQAAVVTGVSFLCVTEYDLCSFHMVVEARVVGQWDDVL